MVDRKLQIITGDGARLARKNKHEERRSNAYKQAQKIRTHSSTGTKKAQDGYPVCVQYMVRRTRRLIIF